MTYDLSTLRVLRERIERADGPDREIDHAIYLQFDFPTHWFGSEIESRFRDGDGYGFNTKDGLRHFGCGAPPNYTASIDAALALVERVLPGWTWEVFSQCFAYVAPSADAQPSEHIDGKGATPPLAILSALLTALIEKESQP